MRKKSMIILFLLYTVFIQASDQKMIISAEKGTSNANYSLYKLEKFFLENKIAKKLKTEAHLELSIELLDGYVLTVIKPIKTVSLKNRLHLLLQNKYPQAFIVPDKHETFSKTSFSVEKKRVNSVKTESNIVQSKKNIEEIVKRDSLIKGLSNELLALIILALAGLFLVYRSAWQIKKIKKLQQKLERYQEKVKTQIDYVGEKYE